MMKTYTRKRLANQEIKEVLDLCRLCLNKPEQGVAIFKDSEDVCAVLAMRIMICVGLEMTYEDYLPNKICTNCCEELERYYKFRRKCEMSYHKLKSHVLAMKEKEKFKNEIEVSIDNDLITKIPLEDDVNVLLEKEQYELKNDMIETGKDDQIVEEVQIPLESEGTPDIATFLTTVFKELGVLVQHEAGLEVEQGTGSFELEVNDDQMMVELVEEDDHYELQETSQSPETLAINIQQEHVDVENNNVKGAKKKSGAWCGECGRVFSTVSGARRHVALHGAARTYTCHSCPRTFTQRASRDRHMLVHLPERPYKCPSCPKSFTQRGSLAAHARSHAAPHARPLALHRCTLCEKLFLYASGLTRHMSTHSGTIYECVTCKRQFNDRSSLLRHDKKNHPKPPLPN